MALGNDDGFWMNLLWGEATTALDETQKCTAKVCACQCVADLAATAFTVRAGEMLAGAAA